MSSLEKALGKTAKRNYVPMPKTGDVPFTHADISAAKRDLGYNPTVGLDEGLQNFVRWYTKYYENGAHQGGQRITFRCERRDIHAGSSVASHH